MKIQRIFLIMTTVFTLCFIAASVSPCSARGKQPPFVALCYHNIMPASAALAQPDMDSIRFEPRALCWILMPETLRGFLKQRLRWAVGGAEAVKHYSGWVWQWKSRRMLGVYIEYIASMLWSYTMLILVGIWLAGVVFNLPPAFSFISWVPQWPGLILGITCLLQFAVSIIMDSRYDYGLARVYLYTVWYPLFYWTVNWLVALPALPIALFFRRSGKSIPASALKTSAKPARWKRLILSACGKVVWMCAISTTAAISVRLNALPT